MSHYRGLLFMSRVCTSRTQFFLSVSNFGVICFGLFDGRLRNAASRGFPYCQSRYELVGGFITLLLDVLRANKSAERSTGT